ncbi:MAG: hypothetical protein QXF14_01905 [Candidatus Woesearchaeota archaeon]
MSHEYDPETGRYYIGKQYCLFVTPENGHMFCLQRSNGSVFFGESIDDLARECARRSPFIGAPLSEDSVGTIPGQRHRVYDYGVSPDDITAFVKAYNSYVEKFTKEGMPQEIDNIRRVM